MRTSIWYVNQAYVTQYSKGRVLCGGDAVHRHPPSSGLGNNTCVQDGHNLGWKLAYAVKGWAGPKLLESYSQERAPVGKQIVLRANQSRLDYAPLNACFRIQGAEILSLPESHASATRARTALPPARPRRPRLISSRRSTTPKAWR